ncbi:MAG: DUF2318 domain-containing protein [Nitrospirae bacterium]|nr:MAG: DUF2318 domain-containing protein [Nitrospirota bacterium]
MQKYRFIALSLVVLILSAACSNLPKEHKVITAKEEVISIPVSEVKDGKVHFFTYKKSGKRINFFIRTDGAGKLSAFFDACYICYKKKKGYREEGADLICNECKLKFRIADEVWENKDCSPILLKSKTGDGNLIIKTEDIEKGIKLF